MITDSTNFENDKVVSSDICIVGAGAAGITVARELIDRKVDVVLLESGDFNPKPELQSLNVGKNVGIPYYDLDATRTRAFGGTSRLWNIDLNNGHLGVRLRGMDKIDFEKRDWVPNSGWPFGRKNLDPYYERAHEICKIGPYSYDVENWEEDSEHSTPLPFENGKIKTTIFQFANKDIFYNDYRKEIEAAENITTLLNTTILKINATDNAKQVSSLQAVSGKGNKFEVKAKYFILAMGALEIPRLLLLSNDVMKNGLGNQNDLVGRFFMEHPHLWRGVYFPSDPEVFDRSELYKIHNNNGVPVMGKLTLHDEVLRKNKLLNFTTSIHPEPMLLLDKVQESFRHIGAAALRGRKAENFQNHFKKCINNWDALAYASLRKMVGGNRKKWFGSNRKYFGFKLNIMAEQVPDPESRVLLDSVRDKFGQNKIKLNWKLNALDIRSIRKALEIIDSELQRANLGHLDIELEGDSIPPDIHGGYHHMGTTRMHNDPKQGVVDENCRIHGIHNLFIAGASVYPTVGYANPTLTTVALSLRLADHLKNTIE